jgi:hypothetical protein
LFKPIQSLPPATSKLGPRLFAILVPPSDNLHCANNIQSAARPCRPHTAMPWFYLSQLHQPYQSHITTLQFYLSHPRVPRSHQQHTTFMQGLHSTFLLGTNTILTQFNVCFALEVHHCQRRLTSALSPCSSLVFTGCTSVCAKSILGPVPRMFTWYPGDTPRQDLELDSSRRSHKARRDLLPFRRRRGWEKCHCTHDSGALSPRRPTRFILLFQSRRARQKQPSTPFHLHRARSLKHEQGGC